METKTIVIMAVSLAAGVGTFFGLNAVDPHIKVRPVLPGGPPADQVFAAPLVETPADTSILIEDAGIDMDALELQAQAAADAAEEGLTEEASDSETGGADGLDAGSTDDGAAVEGDTAGAPVASAEPDPVAEALAQSEVPPPPPAPAAEPARPAPSTAASRPSSTASAPKTVVKKAEPRADALSSWWPQPVAGRLNLVYAGQAAFARAIVLLFDGGFQDASSADAAVKVLDSRGKPVKGRWEIGSNPRMLVFKVSNRGRYTLVVGQALADARGKALGQDLHGPVYVQ
ncbi:MAG TPA: hypothetical protein VFV27_05140 [Nevskiaceae bacterium]|nr:hypothetical protein [Nevskiaceae bacterium]